MIIIMMQIEQKIVQCVGLFYLFSQFLIGDNFVWRNVYIEAINCDF